MTHRSGDGGAPSGLPSLEALPWGSHICQFYRTRADLIETLVPYFAAGLNNGERCVWVCSEPLPVAEARTALGELVPDLDEREQRGDIELFDHDEWYRMTGGPEAVLRAWLEREAAALEQGFTGLRITGNTFWLEPDAYASFQDYEAAVHAAFHDRKIITVCSYSLDRCAPDDVLEVLQRHGSALVRRNERWESVRGATVTLAALAGERRRSRCRQHSVQFYGDGHYPADDIAAFLAAGKDAGRALLVIATAAHLEQIAAAAARAGVDLDEVERQGGARLFQAEDLLPSLLACADHEVGPPREVSASLEALRSAFGQVRIYGELADLLCEHGRGEAAVELERRWNEAFPGGSGVEVLCAYAHESFGEAARPHDLFGGICNEHWAVLPHDADAERSLASGHLLAELEHSRRLFDETRARAERFGEHIAALQRVTAALSGAADVDDLAAVVAGEMARALEADDVVLAVVAGDGGLELRSAAGVGRRLPSDDGMALAVATGRAAYQHIDEAHADTLAWLPLSAGSRPLGALHFRFSSDPALSAPRRALLHDAARQTALALDRALLYERAQLERQRAEAANRAKDEFLAMLGHELRNPLSPIVTALELMRMQAPETFQRERGVIERQVRHMVRLVDDLLDVSRVTRGKIALRRRPLPLAAVVSHAIETVSPLLEGRAHQLDVSVAPDLFVRADEERLTQVVSNVLTNAAKYTPPGGLIEVRAKPRGALAELRVKDNGLGIEPELLPRVFDLFVQAPRGIDRAEGGLGLGLAIVRTLVELHGGNVTVHSDGAGQGSEIVMEVPLASPEHLAARADADGAVPDQAASAKRILIVDDNRDAALALADALGAFGHTVHVAFDGPGALALAERMRPEVALLDIGLPVMDGYEVGRRLRALLEPAPLALIAVTGYGLQTDRARSTRECFTNHVVKPVELKALQRLLHEVKPPSAAA